MRAGLARSARRDLNSASHLSHTFVGWVPSTNDSTRVLLQCSPASIPETSQIRTLTVFGAGGAGAGRVPGPSEACLGGSGAPAPGPLPDPCRGSPCFREPTRQGFCRPASCRGDCRGGSPRRYRACRRGCRPPDSRSAGSRARQDRQSRPSG